MNSPLTHQPSTEARIDAIEMLLQQLVFSLEADPAFTIDNFKSWMALVGDRMTEHRSATPEQIAALARLAEKVTS